MLSCLRLILTRSFQFGRLPGISRRGPGHDAPPGKPGELTLKWPAKIVTKKYTHRN